MKKFSMQQHELKKYMQNSLYMENRIEWTKNVENCNQPGRKFFFFFLKKDVKLVIYDKTRTVFNFENFSWGLCYRSLSTIDLNCFKNRLGTCGFADWQFFFIKFLKKKILYISFIDNPFSIEFASKALQNYKLL